MLRPLIRYIHLFFPDQDLFQSRSYAPIAYEALPKPYHDPFKKQKIKFQQCLNQLFFLLNNSDNHPVLMDIKNTGTLFFKNPTTKNFRLLEMTINKHMTRLKETSTPSLWQKTWHKFLDFISSIRVAFSSATQKNQLFFSKKTDEYKQTLIKLNQDFADTLQQTKVKLTHS